MKVPLIWLKDYLDTSRSASELAASFTQLGLMLDKPLDDLNVLDLEHRMDRSDWLSILGCVRDLAAFEGVNLKYPKLHNKPAIKIQDNEKIKIDIQTKAVRRFQTRIFKGVKIQKSPDWLINRLSAYGMQPINNIVDITNFVMIEYGQPMHAQDIAKLKSLDIVIRDAKEGESLKTILGTQVKLSNDIQILSSGGEPTVILGVVGGQATSVTNSTVDIVLDAGNYDSRMIRHNSRKLKIVNETVSRDDKFLDPRNIDFALDRATTLILEIAGGTYYANDDYYPLKATSKQMTLRTLRLKLLSGMDIPLDTITKILVALEYKIISTTDSEINVEVPYFRTDIEVEDDLVSDVLRIHNYNNIPLYPLSSPVPQDITPAIYKFEDKLRDLLVAQGAHEHITSSLTTSIGKSDEIILANALSSDQNALRRDLNTQLTKVKKTYQKHKIKSGIIFEIGKVFRKSDTAYLEGRLLTVMSNADSLATLFASLGITKYHINQKHEILVADGVVGTIDPTNYTLVTDRLRPHYVPYQGIISDFDHTTKLDLSLLVRSDLKYANIATSISHLKCDYLDVVCKSVTKLDDKTNNYLLTITWDSASPNIEKDKQNILTTLKKELEIESKS